MNSAPAPTKQSRFQSKEFSDTEKMDEWLNSINVPFKVIGYSAYGVGDVRHHTEFMPGIYITIELLKEAGT